MYVYYNGEFTIKSDIEHAAAGFQFGYGVFETILIKQGIPCFFELHNKRLANACDLLNLKLGYSADEMYQDAVRLSLLCGIQEGRLKIICFRDAGKDSLLMTITAYHLEEHHYQRGFSLATSSIKRNPYSPLCYLKSMNYLENILAREEAKQAGYDEALLLNVHGKLCEGSVSNLFWVKDDTLFTPEVSCGLLKGITRKQVIQICRKLSIKLKQGTYALAELEDAEEVFLTNSLMGVMPVGRLDHIIYHKKDCGCTQMITNEYNKLLNTYKFGEQRNKTTNEDI